MAKEIITDKRINEKVPQSCIAKIVREVLHNKKIGRVVR